jgi:1,4-dihydroxy-2-naphthoate octaprenyltransferase
MSESNKLDLIRHIRPLHLLTTWAMYSLGAGFADFLGKQIDPVGFLIGIIWLSAISVGLNFLGDYFQTPFDEGLVTALEEDDSAEFNQAPKKNEVLLYSAAAALAVGALLTVFWTISGQIFAELAFMLVLYFLLYGSLVVPGLGLDQSGIGEFLVSIVLVVVPPAVGYLLQVGEFHRFLTLAIFPLYPLHLALILSLRLKTYARDLKHGKTNLLVRLGWQRAIVIHNLMILSGFLLFGIALLFGMSIRMIGPVFFTLPIAGYLIWYLSGLERGAPVRWKLIRLLSLVVFFLPVYLIFYTAWFQ